MSRCWFGRILLRYFRGCSVRPLFGCKIRRRCVLRRTFRRCVTWLVLMISNTCVLRKSWCRLFTVTKTIPCRLRYRLVMMYCSLSIPLYIRCLVGPTKVVIIRNLLSLRITTANRRKALKSSLGLLINNRKVIKRTYYNSKLIGLGVSPIGPLVKL